MTTADPSISRALIPRVLTPSATVAELLFLFREQPQPSQCYAIVRLAGGGHCALMLEDLDRAARQLGDALLAMPLAAVPDLLRSNALFAEAALASDRAKREARQQPRRRAIVADERGAIVGVFATSVLAAPRDIGSASALGLLGRDPPAVLSPAAPNEVKPAPAHLNTAFEGLAADQPLVVGAEHVLLIDVGAPAAQGRARTSRPFAFDFAGQADPVSFTVQVDGDPEVWAIRALDRTLIVAPPGRTTHAARFGVTPRRAGEEPLVISVEQLSGALVQKVWLPVTSAEPGAVEPAKPAARERPSAVLPYDAAGLTPASVELTILPGERGSLVTVRANLPGEVIRETYSLPLSGAEIQNAARRLRDELATIVNEPSDRLGRAFPFASLSTVGVDRDTARAAYVRLADAGQQIWQMIFQAPRGEPGVRELAHRLREQPTGSRFQVVIENQEFIIPWALLYDKPGPIDAETLEWQGFWGYRYVIDVLPPGRYPAPVIADDPARALVLFNDDQELAEFTARQRALFQGRLAGDVRSGTAAVIEALKAPPSSALLYCYCHGKQTSGAARAGDLAAESALSFGGAQRWRLADLRRLPVGPLPARPLVFLNACEGAAQDALFYDGFMPYFVEELLARGFIGAEVAAPQLLADDFARRFLAEFADGRPVGTILLGLRRHYLDAHNNILAFNYSLYCLADVCLAGERPAAIADAQPANAEPTALVPAAPISEPAAPMPAETPAEPVPTLAPAGVVEPPPLTTQPDRTSAILPAAGVGGGVGMLQPWLVADVRRRAAALESEIAQRRAEAEQNRGGQGIHRSQLQALALMMSELLGGQRQLLGQLDQAGLTAAQIAQIVDQIQSEIVGTQSLWRVFRAIFAQRDDPQARQALDAADLIAHDCYQTIMGRVQGAPLRAPPLTFLDARRAAITANRNTSAEAVGLAIERYERERLPIPIIMLPADQAASLWLFTILHHEVGHNLDEDLRHPIRDERLSAELALRLRAGLEQAGAPPRRQRAWQGWAAELLADAFGVLLGGAGFALTLGALLQAFPRAGAVQTGGEHPDSALRLAILAALLRGLQVPQLEPTARWLDQALGAGPQPLDLAAFVGDLKPVVRATLDTPLETLGGRALRAIAPDPAADAQQVAALAASLAGPAPAGPAGPPVPYRLIPAAAQVALAGAPQPRAEALAALHARALACVTQQPRPAYLPAGDAELDPRQAQFLRRLAAGLLLA